MYLINTFSFQNFECYRVITIFSQHIFLKEILIEKIILKKLYIFK